MQNRENVIKVWLKQVIGQSEFTLTPLAGDASFRRYFRVEYNGLTRIVMDAPPEQESVEPFIRVHQALSSAQILCPQIYAVDNNLGFLLLEDFGDHLLINVLNPESADFYYGKAMATILHLQKCRQDNWENKDFDASFMLMEMNLFKTWFLERYLSLKLTTTEEALISHTMNWIAEQVARQPKAFIHRDYHSRNLMMLANNEIGVIDFQDAMNGPVTYDLVSLLKDCYISWPRAKVLEWVTDFYHRSNKTENQSLENFIQAFDISGIQRHLKVLGVFSRLYLRDNKSNYLKDLPLTLGYILECTQLYPELQALSDFFNNRVYLP